MGIFSKPLEAPRPFDPDRAEDLIDELREVLGKRRACLVVRDGVMVLAVQNAYGDGWRAIAQIECMAKQGPTTWRPTTPLPLPEVPPS